MTELRAGDAVVTSDALGSLALERVVLNLHVDDSRLATMLKIETDLGAAVTVTPDHVISVNGKFAAAEQATVGAALSAGTVVRVTPSRAGVINPVTVAGTILVADVDAPSKPLLASTYPEWIASYMLSAPAFPFVAARVLSYIAPEAFQAYFQAAEDVVEEYITPSAQLTGATLPMAFAPAAVAVDFAFGLGFLLRSLAIPLGMAGVVVHFARQK